MNYLLRISALLTLLSTITLPAYAASTQFCSQYAQTSIRQQIANVAYDCRQRGLRWSPLYEGQKQWCMSVREAVANKETQARQTTLATCKAPVRKIAWNSLDSGLWDPLFDQMLAATKIDDVVAVKVMHAQGISIHHEWGFNYGAMIYHAIDHQAEKTATYLLSQGARPNSSTNGGGGSLSNMLDDPKVNYRMLSMLLQRGADPNYAGEAYTDSAYPLLTAVMHNDLRAVRILLNAGANPNRFADDPAIIHAIKKRNLPILQALVNAGANVNTGPNHTDCANGSSNNLPLDQATASGHQPIIQFLRSRGAKLRSQCG